MKRFKEHLTENISLLTIFNKVLRKKYPYSIKFVHNENMLTIKFDLDRVAYTMANHSEIGIRKKASLLAKKLLEELNKIIKIEDSEIIDNSKLPTVDLFIVSDDLINLGNMKSINKMYQVKEGLNEWSFPIEKDGKEIGTIEKSKKEPIFTTLIRNKQGYIIASVLSGESADFRAPDDVGIRMGISKSDRDIIDTYMKNKKDLLGTRYKVFKSNLKKSKKE